MFVTSFIILRPKEWRLPMDFRPHLTSGTTRSWRCEQVWTGAKMGDVTMLFHAVSSCFMVAKLADFNAFTFKRPQNEEIPHSTGIFSIWGKGLINKPRCWCSNGWTARYSTPKTWWKYTWRNILVQSFNPNPQIKELFWGDTLDTSVSGISALSLIWII